MLRYLFVDFNAFFASVEQHHRPELRNRPIGIVAVKTERTCFITTSYQARQFGIKTGTSVKVGLRLCPELIVVEARPSVYIEMHHQLVELISSCIPITQVCSIDEVLCQLQGSECTANRALTIAHQIKHKLRREISDCITCSIGIAPNPYLAKTASDLEKPDGLVVLTEDDIPRRLLHLELRDLCGIGPRMEKRLNDAGITTIAQLYAASKQMLRAIWGGIEGERFYEKLRGHSVDQTPSSRQTVGHSHVLPPEFRSCEHAFMVAHRLLQKATARLRRYGLLAGRMNVGMHLLPHIDWQEHITVMPTNDPFLLGSALRQLWLHAPRYATPFLVWINFSQLIETNRQLELPLDPNRLRREQLLAALDRVNEQHGPGTMYIATSHEVRTAAPMRIPFSTIPSPAHEDDSH